MQYQFLHTDYADNNYESIPRWYVRDENGVKTYFDIYGHKPYCYFPESTYIPNKKFIEKVDNGFVDIFGNKAKRVTVTSPKDIISIRGNTVISYEAKIIYLLRVLIDSGVYSLFTIKGKSIKNKVHISQIIPVDHTVIFKPVVCGLDIEVDTPKKFPDNTNPINVINCVTIKFSTNDIYLTYLLDYESEFKEDEKFDNWIVYTYNNEKEMLLEIRNRIREVNPDIIYGWYIQFDTNYLIARLEYLGEEWGIKGYIEFDLIPFYRKIRGGGLGNSLKMVIVEEFPNIEVVLGEYDNELWTKRENHEKLVLYNKNDVYYCDLINEKYGGKNSSIIDFFWYIKARSGLYNLEDTLYNTRIIDSLVLRKAKEWGIVLPTAEDHEVEDYAGGLVLETVKGIHKNAILLDFSMFFPSTIIMGNYSPEYAHLSLEERLKQPLGIAPVICQSLMVDRIAIDKQLYSIMQEYGANSEEYITFEKGKMTIKYLLNAVYGYFAYRKCRLYTRKMMGEMVSMTRKILLVINKIAQICGYKVILGDTDSIFIEIEEEEIEYFMKLINLSLKKLAEKMGMKPLWNLKYEIFADRVLVASKKGEERGAKKKYVYRVIIKDGVRLEQPYIVTKGFELKKGDSSKVTKTVQKDCIKAIFDDTIEEFIVKTKKLIHDIKTTLPLDDIAIPKNLSRELNDYTSHTDYIRGSIYSTKNGIEEISKNDRIKMLYVKYITKYPTTDVICVTDLSKLPELVIDYDKVIEKTIRLKIENLLEIVGYTWNNLIGQKSLLSIMTK